MHFKWDSYFYFALFDKYICWHLIKRGKILNQVFFSIVFTSLSGSPEHDIAKVAGRKQRKQESKHCTQIFKKYFQLPSFSVFAFRYPASVLLMAIMTLNRAVCICLQTFALAAEKQYSGWRSSKMPVLLGIRNSQDALHAGNWVLFSYKSTFNFDGSRSGAFCLSPASGTGVSISMPTWKVHTGIPGRGTSQKGFLLEDFVSKSAPFCLGSSKPYRLTKRHAQK